MASINVMANSVQRVEWRNLIDRAFSMADDVNSAAFLQLATVDVVHGAQVRTVVFRGFSDNSDRLFIATDLGSQKVEQVARDNRVQIAWYFSEAREQFRLSGSMSCVDSKQVDQEPRGAVWNSMSLSARASFFCDAMGQELDGARELASCVTPPANFALLVLTILEVELLSLTQRPHLRRRFWLADEGWRHQQIAL